MTDSKKWTGGCLCGAVSYTVSDEPFMSEYCHCRMCQRVAGAAVANWVDFKREHIHWDEGEPTEYKSSKFARRGFCNHCGSTLSFRDTRYPDYYTLATGSLDDPEAFAPTRHIFVESQLSWLDINDHCERFDRDAGDWALPG